MATKKQFFPLFFIVILALSFSSLFLVNNVKATRVDFGVTSTKGYDSGWTNSGANELKGGIFQFPTTTQNTTFYLVDNQVSVSLEAIGSSHNVEMVVYNSSGHMIALSSSIVVTTSVSWRTFQLYPFACPSIQFTNNTVYWFGLIGDGTFYICRSLNENEFPNVGLIVLTDGNQGTYVNPATQIDPSKIYNVASPYAIKMSITDNLLEQQSTYIGSVYAKVNGSSPSVCNVNIIDFGAPFSNPYINYTSIDRSVSLPFIYGHQYSFSAYGYGNSTVRWCNDATNTNYTVNPLKLTLYSAVNMTAYYTLNTTGTIFTTGGGGAQTGINFVSSGHGSLTWTVTTEPQLGDTGNTGGLGFYGSFITGDTISLVAVPDSGYTFSNFNIGGGSGGIPYSNSPTTFTFLTNTTVVVNFIAIGSGGGNKGGNILGAFGILDSYLAVAIYAICIIGLSIGFYYLRNTNIPFAVALGLIIATIICNIINVLGIYTYPIDALTILSIVGIIVLMRH
jgi:hypothetical protein